MKKKAQEEMVGLVVIMLIVAVISLIFLGIFLRKGPSNEKLSSVEISQFLSSSMEYTTTCSLNSGYSYLDLSDLFDECNKGSLCSSGNACDILEQTMTEVIESSWNFSPDSPQKSYYFQALLEDQASLANFPLYTECPGAKRGADKSISILNGKIIISLELCLS